MKAKNEAANASDSPEQYQNGVTDKPETVDATVRWPFELHRMIREIALNEGRSFHGQVVWMLKRYIAEHYEK